MAFLTNSPAFEVSYLDGLGPPVDVTSWLLTRSAFVQSIERHGGESWVLRTPFAAF